MSGTPQELRIPVVNDDGGPSAAFEHLWTPYRMAYIRGENKPATGAAEDCPFDRIPTLGDVEGLVVARGETVYAVLNLYPYNAGHLMVVPYRHVPTTPTSPTPRSPSSAVSPRRRCGWCARSPARTGSTSG